MGKNVQPGGNKWQGPKKPSKAVRTRWLSLIDSVAWLSPHLEEVKEIIRKYMLKDKKGKKRKKWVQVPALLQGLRHRSWGMAGALQGPRHRSCSMAGALQGPRHRSCSMAGALQGPRHHSCSMAGALQGPRHHSWGMGGPCNAPIMPCAYRCGRSLTDLRSKSMGPS